MYNPKLDDIIKEARKIYKTPSPVELEDFDQQTALYYLETVRDFPKKTDEEIEALVVWKMQIWLDYHRSQQRQEKHVKINNSDLNRYLNERDKKEKKKALEDDMLIAAIETGIHRRIIDRKTGTLLLNILTEKYGIPFREYVEETGENPEAILVRVIHGADDIFPVFLDM